MTDINWEEAKQSLKHVCWIGGSTCAGKTTISKRIAEDFGFVRYDCDAHIGEHIAAATENCPTLCRLRSEGPKAFFRWLFVQKPEKIAEVLQYLNQEHLLMTVKDLLNMASDIPSLWTPVVGIPPENSVCLQIKREWSSLWQLISLENKHSKDVFIEIASL